MVDYKYISSDNYYEGLFVGQIHSRSSWRSIVLAALWSHRKTEQVTVK